MSELYGNSSVDNSNSHDSGNNKSIRYCTKCRYELSNPDARFCPHCGTRIAKASEKPKCQNCGAELTDSGAQFCPYCGERTNGDTKDELIEKQFERAAKAVSGAVKTVSNTTGTLVDKAKSLEPKKKKSAIIAAAASVFVIIALVLVLNIHRCDECDRVYFGKQYELSFFGETEKICGDCYHDWW